MERAVVKEKGCNLSYLLEKICNETIVSVEVDFFNKGVRNGFTTERQGSSGNRRRKGNR